MTQLCKELKNASIRGEAIELLKGAGNEMSQVLFLNDYGKTDKHKYNVILSKKEKNELKNWLPAARLI